MNTSSEDNNHRIINKRDGDEVMRSIMKKLPLFILLLLLVVLAACNSKTTDGEENTTGDEGEEAAEEPVNTGGELKVAYPAQPQTLDMQVSGAIATTDIMWHVYETLIGVDNTFAIQPMLAESYEQSDDGLTVTFHLRQGVKFHNGEEMTSEDVVASMERYKRVSTHGKSLFSDVTFEADGDYTVIMTLPEPRSTALNTLAYPSAGHPAIMPKEIADNSDDTGVAEHIGTGPFMFHEWKQDQHVHLKKFDDYQALSGEPSLTVGEKKALVDDLIFVFTPDSNTQASGLQSGEYDIAHEVNRDNAARLAEDENITNYVYPDAYLVANFNKKQGLFTDKNARQAVSAALDMEAILQGAFTDSEYYKLNHNNMMYHQLELWDSDVGKDKYNIADEDLAKELLEQANYDGEEIVIITDREYEEHYNASVVIQDQLERIGMNVDLQVYDWPTVLTKIYEEDQYDIYVMGLTPNPEPSAVRYFTRDYAGFTDSEELDEILRTFRGKPNLEAAYEDYEILQEWYWDFMPAVRIGDYDAIVSVRSNVKGYEEQNKQHRPIYWNVWVEE